MSVPVTKIAGHALARFRERTGAKYNDAKIVEKLFDWVSKGVEVQLKPAHRVKALLSHGLRDARYIEFGGYVIVVEGDEIKTIYAKDRSRYQ